MKSKTLIIFVAFQCKKKLNGLLNYNFDFPNDFTEEKINGEIRALKLAKENNF